VKSYIQRFGLLFRGLVETGDDAEPFGFLYAALDNVTPAATMAWFHHSGYL
jgi:hypothetical protein